MFLQRCLLALVSQTVVVRACTLAGSCLCSLYLFLSFSVFLVSEYLSGLKACAHMYKHVTHVRVCTWMLCALFTLLGYSFALCLIRETYGIAYLPHSGKKSGFPFFRWEKKNWKWKFFRGWGTKKIGLFWHTVLSVTDKIVTNLRRRKKMKLMEIQKVCEKI